MGPRRRWGRALALLAGSAGLFALCATSAFATPKISTTISIDSGQYQGSDYAIAGRLGSPNPKCLKNRTMHMVGTTQSNEDKVLDTGYSSRRGAWVLASSKFFDFTPVHIKVDRKRIGPKGHRRICKAATELVI